MKRNKQSMNKNTVLTAAYYYKQPGGISFVLFTLLSQFSKALSDVSRANKAGLNKLVTLQRAVQCITHLRSVY